MLASLIFQAASAPALADEIPDAASIRAHVRAAEGTPPASLTRVVTYVAGGLGGHRTIYRKGQDVREIDEAGPFVVQSGKFRGQAWHQNANGETVLEQPDPGNAVADPFTTTVSAIATPVHGYLVAELNGAGSGTKEYVDGTTWRLVRRDFVRPIGTTVVAYDDFRTTQGSTTAWHWTRRDGHVENDAEYRIERESHADVAAADLGIAAARSTFVELPVGKRQVELPVRQERNTFLVRVNVGSRGLDFILDTGAAGITIDEDVARELGLKVYGRSSSAENAGRYVGGRVVLPRATIGELQLHDVVVSTLPHLGVDQSGVYKAVGLLGFDFLGAQPLAIDYERGRVTAIDPGSFEEPKKPGTLALDVRLGSQVPMTDVTVNGALGERFIVDTGSPAPLFLFDYFQRRHKGAMVDKGGGGAARFRRYNGVGGSYESRPYQLDDVTVGNVRFKDFVGYAIQSRTAYSGNADGLLGSEFFRYFTMYLDYADSRIYLEPNSRARQ